MHRSPRFTPSVFQARRTCVVCRRALVAPNVSRHAGMPTVLSSQNPANGSDEPVQLVQWEVMGPTDLGIPKVLGVLSISHAEGRWFDPSRDHQ